MIKILKGKMANIRKNYYKNNIDAFISYLEDNRRKYALNAFEEVENYNKAMLELEREIENLENSKDYISTSYGKTLLERAKKRFTAMKDNYEKYVAVRRENILSFDLKIKEAKARKHLVITASKIKFIDNKFNNSFENDFNEIENLLNEMELEQEATFRTIESLPD